MKRCEHHPRSLPPKGTPLGKAFSKLLDYTNLSEKIRRGCSIKHSSLSRHGIDIYSKGLELLNIFITSGAPKSTSSIGKAFLNIFSLHSKLLNQGIDSYGLRLEL